MSGNDQTAAAGRPERITMLARDRHAALGIEIQHGCALEHLSLLW
jgi:hypothetical protein